MHVSAAPADARAEEGPTMVQEQELRNREVRDRGERDRGEIVLAAIVAGGATVAGMSAPPVISMAGHTGAEYVYLAVVIGSPFVFIVAGLIGFLVYGFGRSRMHPAMLAAVTAAIVAALGFATLTLVGGLSAVIITSVGTLAAAPIVFVSLWLVIAIRRHRRVVRASREVAAAEAGSMIWTPRMRLGVIALLAGLAAGVPPFVGSMVQSWEFLADPIGGMAVEFIGWSFVGAIPIILATAWTVLIVLLVDQWVAPRLVRAVSAGALTAVVFAVPSLIVGGGFEDGGVPALQGLLSGLAAAVVVYFSERRTAPVASPGLVGSGEAQ
jgi:hypothetical protein